MCGAGGGCRTGRPPSCSRASITWGARRPVAPSGWGRATSSPATRSRRSWVGRARCRARKLDLADDLQERLPEVGDALYAGWLDEPKARTICDQTRDLADDHAHEVCRIVLPEAPELPVGALIERIEQVATALDPEWAQRRRQRAEARARVILSPNPSGTANLSFCDAPAPDGIASQARIDALAAAVRHLGVLIPIGVLRLQVGLRLLDGSTAGMDDRTIALLLAAEHHAQNTPDDPDDDPDDGPDGTPTTPVTTAPGTTAPTTTAPTTARTTAPTTRVPATRPDDEDPRRPAPARRRTARRRRSRAG